MSDNVRLRCRTTSSRCLPAAPSATSGGGSCRTWLQHRRGRSPVASIAHHRRPATYRRSRGRSASRGNPQPAGWDNSPRRAAVTVALPKEGTSTAASNLASVIEQDGERVMAIDADLWRPAPRSTVEAPSGEELRDFHLGGHPNGHDPARANLTSHLDSQSRRDFPGQQLNPMRPHRRRSATNPNPVKK